MKFAFEKEIGAFGVIGAGDSGGKAALIASVRGLEKIPNARKDAEALAEIFDFDPSALQLRPEVKDKIASARSAVDEARRRVRDEVIAQFERELDAAIEEDTLGAVSQFTGVGLTPDELRAIFSLVPHSAGASEVSSEPLSAKEKDIIEQARENGRRVLGQSPAPKAETKPETKPAPVEEFKAEPAKKGKQKLKPVIFFSFCGGRPVRYGMPDIFGLSEGSIGAFQKALVKHLQTVKRCPVEERSMALRTAQGSQTHKDLCRFVRVAGEDFNYLIDLASDEVMSGAGDTGAWTLGQILSQRELDLRDMLTLFHFASIRMFAFTDRCKDADAKSMFDRLAAEEAALDKYNNTDRPGWANGAYALLKAYLQQTRELWRACRGWEAK